MSWNGKNILVWEFFIEKIKMRKHLYDKGEKLYRDMGAARKAWEDIAIDMDMADHGPLTGEETERLWNSLKRKYMEERKARKLNQKKNVDRSPWILYSLMSFVNPHLQEREKKTKRTDLSQKPGSLFETVFVHKDEPRSDNESHPDEMSMEELEYDSQSVESSVNEANPEASGSKHNNFPIVCLKYESDSYSGARASEKPRSLQQLLGDEDSESNLEDGKPNQVSACMGKLNFVSANYNGHEMDVDPWNARPKKLGKQNQGMDISQNHNKDLADLMNSKPMNPKRRWDQHDQSSNTDSQVLTVMNQLVDSTNAIMSKLSDKEDRASLVSQMVATKMRKYDARSQIVLEKKIHDLFFDFEMEHCPQ